ncbi:MAG TPA: tetratricopeptide repeat protein, partial [Kofleriaceae bacterium]
DPMARAASAQRTWRLAIGAVEGATDKTVGPAPRPKRRTGPTKLVIDYRTRPNEPAPAAAAVQSEDDPAIASARGAYNRGNQRLFVGDLEGAVRAYQESLDLYPGYVGGYRGLGLAYAELGEKPHALDALKSYIAAAPGARDVALIKKRIARLQGK